MVAMMSASALRSMSRDEVVAALGVDFDRIEARQAAHDQVAGAPGGADADIEEWLHEGR